MQPIALVITEKVIKDLFLERILDSKVFMDEFSMVSRKLLC